MTFPISMIAVGKSEPVICDITKQSAISLKYQNIKLKTINKSYSVCTAQIIHYALHYAEEIH